MKLWKKIVIGIVIVLVILLIAAYLIIRNMFSQPDIEAAKGTDETIGTTEELKQMLEHDRTERENREVGKHRNDGSVQSVCKEQTDNQIQESYQEQQKTLTVHCPLPLL